MGVIWIVSVHSFITQTCCMGPVSMHSACQYPAFDIAEILMPLVMMRMIGLVQSGPKHLLVDLSHLPLVLGQVAGTLVKSLGRLLLGLCLHEQLTMIVEGLGQAEHAPLLIASFRVGNA